MSKRWNIYRLISTPNGQAVHWMILTNAVERGWSWSWRHDRAEELDEVTLVARMMILEDLHPGPHVEYRSIPIGEWFDIFYGDS